MIPPTQTPSIAPVAPRPASPPPPPPSPRLSAVEQGDVAAGRLSTVEGRVFAVPPAGTSNPAPPTVRWGEQPAGTPYRQTFESVAARIGTSDPATVSAEIDRQLYGTAAPATARTISTPAAAATSEEGVGSFLDGAVRGNFSDNTSWSATGGQVVVGFVPVLGQIADARDTVASIGQVARGEEGGWLNLGASVVGWVPGVGDGLKAAIRGGSHVAEAGADVARTAARQGDEVAGAVIRQADEAIPRKQIVMEGGGKGEWPKELNARNLEANADYLVNGYKYGTDAQGRVTHVEGKLDLETAQRNDYQQKVSGRADRLPDDQGGHLIASIFNGPGDRLNLVPMNGNFNMGAWRQMEAKFEAALKRGEQVEVKIEAVYSGVSGRPDGFVVTSRIDGGRPVRDTFVNAPGGR